MKLSSAHTHTHYMCRLLYVPPALIAGILGLAVDVPLISTIALCKSPYMLVKGWHRLLQDCVGREGPFLETICVPFAGLAVLLWPLVVAGAVLCSIASTIFLGAYAAVVVYQVTTIMTHEREVGWVSISAETPCFCFECRRALSGLDSATLLLHCLSTTNTATTCSTCPKDHAFPGSNLCSV